MISIKSAREIAIIRENALLLVRILEEVVEQARPGISTGALDRLAERLIRRAGATPAFKGYRGYPATLCASLNEEVVHGIPRDDRILREGDLLSLDLGLFRRGFYADWATTVILGEGSPRAQRLLEVTWEAEERGIEAALVGNHVSDISHAIGSYVEEQGYHVVKEYTGHGIGRKLHDDPQIPNFGPPGEGPRLRAGMVLCIEAMVMEDEGSVRLLPDGWTAVTPKGGLAAHFEEMVLVTETGPEILTRGGARSLRAALSGSAER
jgi:methionyl aminopeptidase